MIFLRDSFTSQDNLLIFIKLIRCKPCQWQAFATYRYLAF